MIADTDRAMQKSPDITDAYDIIGSLLSENLSAHSYYPTVSFVTAGSSVITLSSIKVFLEDEDEFLFILGLITKYNEIASYEQQLDIIFDVDRHRNACGWIFQPYLLTVDKYPSRLMYFSNLAGLSDAGLEMLSASKSSSLKVEINEAHDFYKRDFVKNHSQTESYYNREDYVSSFVQEVHYNRRYQWLDLVLGRYHYRYNNVDPNLIKNFQWAIEGAASPNAVEDAVDELVSVGRSYNNIVKLDKEGSIFTAGRPLDRQTEQFLVMPSRETGVRWEA